MNKKSLGIGLLLGLLLVLLVAFVPSLTDFNANQFGTANKNVTIKNAAAITNLQGWAGITANSGDIVSVAGNVTANQTLFGSGLAVGNVTVSAGAGGGLIDASWGQFTGPFTNLGLSYFQAAVNVSGGPNDVGTANFSDTNGIISQIRSVHQSTSNNTVCLPTNSLQGLVVSYTKSASTNQLLTLNSTTAGQYPAWKTDGTLSASNLPVVGVAPGSNVTTSTNAGVVTVNSTGGAFPLAADGNAAGFAITNLSKLSIGAVPADTGAQSPSVTFGGTNSAGNPTQARIQLTNALLRFDLGTVGGGLVSGITMSSNNVITLPGSFGALSVGANGVNIGVQNITVGSAGLLGFSGKGGIQQPSDGVYGIANNAITDFGRLWFGGSTATFPGLKRNKAGLDLVGADGTYNGTNSLVVPGSITASNGIVTTLSNLLAAVSFTAPATTVNWTNPIASDIYVFIDNSGVTGTSIKLNGSQIYSSLIGDVMIPLQVNEYFSMTYTVGTPSCTWKPR